jgi:large repetitive protein
MKTDYRPTWAFSIAFWVLVGVPFHGAPAAAATGSGPVPHALPLSVAAIGEGQIARPGELDRFRLEVQTGQRLLFDALNDNGGMIMARLESPSGRIPFEVLASTDGWPVYATETGTYTLSLYGVNGATGDYRFRILDLAAVEEMDLHAPVTGRLNPGSQTQAYQFHGTAGQRMRFDSLAASAAAAEWSLLAPFDLILLSSDIGSDLGEITLPATGTYWILVQGLTSNTQSLDYQAQAMLITEPSGVPARFGTIHIGAIEHGETNTFHYTAPAGTTVFFDSLGGQSSWLIADLFGPDGALVSWTWARDDSRPVTLPLSGSYTLELRPYAASFPVESYAFRLLDLNSSAVPLEIGVVAEGFLELATATDVYQFEGLPGQRFYLDFIETLPFAVQVELVAPSGQTIPGPWWGSAMGEGLFTLTEPGRHLLFVRNNRPWPVEYRLRILDLDEAPTVMLGFDTPVHGVLERGFQTDLFRFDGWAGQRLFFDSQTSVSDAAWIVYTPDSYAWLVRNLADDFEMILPVTGTYALAVVSHVEHPVLYAFELVTAQTTSQPLLLGPLTETTLGSRGEQLRFNFHGSVGQRLYFDGLGGDFPELYSGLLAPDGWFLFQQPYVDADYGPFTLALDGTYTLVIGGNTGELGSVRFRLIDLDQPPVMQLALEQTVSGTLDPGSATDLYLLDGETDQRLVIQSLDRSSPADWTLYVPENYPYAAGALRNNAMVDVSWPGTRVLAITSSSTEPVAYGFVVRRPPTTTTSISLGTLIEGMLTEPGIEHRYTFAGEAGMLLYFDAQGLDPIPLRLKLLDPENVIAFSHDTALDGGPTRLFTSGTYTLIITGFDHEIAPYRFRLLDMDASVELATELDGELSPPNATEIFRFEGQAGQRVLLEQLAEGDGGATWRLLTPSVQVLQQAVINEPLPECFLREDGTHYLVIEGFSTGTEPIKYRIRRSVSDPAGVASGFGVVHSGTIAFAETHVFDYVAPAGLLVYFDSMGSGLLLEIQFRSAAGTVVFEGSATPDYGPWRLPDSGPYTLAIRGQHPAATGDYRFRLLDLAVDSTPIDMGVTIDASITETFGTRIFRFDGSVGQVFYYDPLTTSGPFNHRLVGLTPGGGILIHQSAFYDHGPELLPLPGTYYLLLHNDQGEEPVDLSFRLLDTVAPPAVPLAVGELRSGTLDPGGSTHIYRIPIDGQSRLFFSGSSSVPEVWWSLHTSKLSWISGGSLPDEVEFALPAHAESLLLFVRGTQPEPVPYTVELMEVITTSSDLKFGEVTSGNLSRGGAEHRFTFTASSGQTIYYDALEADFDPVHVKLISPSGQWLASGNADHDFGPILLLETGMYTLLLESMTLEQIDFRFRLLDGATQPALALDTPIANTLEAGYAAHMYRLESVAGLSLFFQSLDTPPVTGSWDFRSPEGGQLAAGNLNHYMVARLTSQAAHWLIISSESSAEIPYSFQVIPGNNPPLLDPIDDRTIYEEIALEFTVTASDPQSPNDVLTFTLDPGAPDGATIDPVTGIFRWTPSENQGPGKHSITVRVTDDGIPMLTDARTFLIQVREVNRPPELGPLADLTIHAGAAVQLNIPVSDPDLPGNQLFIWLDEAPPSATLNALEGRFTWISSFADAGASFPVVVRVVDDGTPPLSVADGFTISVLDPLRIVTVAVTEGGVTLQWHGIAGSRYRLEHTAVLDAPDATVWVGLDEEILSPGGVTSAVDPSPDRDRQRYYRILGLP